MVVAVTDEYSAGMHGHLSVGYTTPYRASVYSCTIKPQTIYMCIQLVRNVVGYWFSIGWIS